MLASRDRRWKRHVTLVQEEIRDVTRAESHWLKDHRWCGELLRKLVKLNPDSLSEIKDIATVFSDTAPSPVPTLLDVLRREAAQLPRNKQRTLAVLEHLGTHAVRLGYLAADAKAAVGGVAYSEDVQAIVDNIGASLQPRQFTCIVRLYGDRPTIQALIEPTDVRFAKHRDFPRDNTAQCFKVLCFRKGIDRDREVALAVPAKAVTHSKAVDDALHKCRPIVDMPNFYENRAAIQINPTVLVSDEHQSQIVDRRTEQSVATKARRNAQQLARRALTESRHTGLHEALGSALEQHSIALASSDAMAGLVGMWTALECLVGGSGTDSAIDRIVRWVPPTVAARRVDKITRYLAVCCHYFYGTMSARPNALFARSSPYWMSVRDVCEAITGKERNNLVQQLLKDVASHPLLRFRVYESWKNMHEPKTVQKQLEISKQRLAWHLERIYRARNMTVHMGAPPPYLLALIDHVQYYFSRCVYRILADLDSHPNWSVATSLEHHRQQFDFIVETLRDTSSQVPATLFFPSDDDFRGFHPWQQ